MELLIKKTCISYRIKVTKLFEVDEKLCPRQYVPINFGLCLHYYKNEEILIALKLHYIAY